MKISMRLDYTLEDYSLEDQIRIAADVGVDGVETGQLLDFDCEKAAALCANYNVPFAACGYYDMWNARMGNPYEEIKDNLIKTIECAKTLGTSTLLSLTDNSEDRSEAFMQQFVENMKPVAELFEKHGMTAVVEPHNTVYHNPFYDFSKYYMNTTVIGYEALKRIGSDSIKLLFDFYHVQTMEGNLIMNIKEHFDSIGHYHIAGVPDRDEPWNGELNYVNLVNLVDSMGYNGYFGMEYYPTDIKQTEVLAEAVRYLKTGKR
ncbi:MAG: TIM barrel protein [Christensenellaceae bacterium]|jgi:hydroxypyruvate isomerase